MINAQYYIDSVYGVNKERDSKKEHSYYLKIIQNLLIQKDNILRISKDKYTKSDLHDIVHSSHCHPQRIKLPDSNKCASFVIKWIELNKEVKDV